MSYDNERVIRAALLAKCPGVNHATVPLIKTSREIVINGGTSLTEAKPETEIASQDFYFERASAGSNGALLFAGFYRSPKLRL